MWDILLDSVVDSVKIFPFLLITYILMEYLGHKAGKKANALVGRAGRLGPLLGGVLGALPQCGFSAAASNLYACRLISVGTLAAIFLSTSDEMLPVMISQKFPVSVMLQILFSKMLIAVVAGMVIDTAINKKQHKKSGEDDISRLSEHGHCHCKKDIFRSALWHSMQILFFIFCMNLLLNSVIGFIGQKRLAALAAKGSVIGIFLSAFVGLIPNCAASVVITQLYLERIISTGAMMAGLLAGSGVGVLVLFRMNRHVKENIKITAVIYAIGVLAGLVLEAAGISFM